MADELVESGVSRRTAVQGALVAGIGLPPLAACGDEGSEGGSGASAGQAAGTTLTKSAEVPVGGGVIVDKTVVVQPAEGTFQAWSAICPHEKCTFTEVTDGRIRCGGCHQAEFDAATGKNLVGPNGGPANLPNLNAITVAVKGDSVVTA